MTRIKRDQKIPIIGFVANTGGLLGLCMGFSLVSAFEIVYHCMLTLCWKSLHLYRRKTMRTFPSRIQQDSIPPKMNENSQKAKSSSLDGLGSTQEALSTNRPSPETLTWNQEIGTISQTLIEGREESELPLEGAVMTASSPMASEADEATTIDADGGRLGKCLTHLI